MQKKFMIPFLIMCVMLSACAASKAPPYGSADNNSNPNQGPAQAQLNLPPVKNDPQVHVRVTNQTQVHEDLAGTLYALLQSEVNATQTNSPGSADYDVSIVLEKFMQVPIEGGGGGDALRTVGVTAATTGLGVTLGSVMGGSTGALIGAGVGLMGGVALGVSASSPNTVAYNAWQMDAFVTVREQNGQVHRARVSERVSASGISMQDAASTALNNIAWAVVRAFQK